MKVMTICNCSKNVLYKYLKCERIEKYYRMVVSFKKNLKYLVLVKM